jgi:3-methyladenine DNA glycosylase AlkD
MSLSSRRQSLSEGARILGKMPTAIYNVKDVLSELESLGSEQTRKTYARHGGTGPMFGVSFANLYAIQKRIKKDHKLAQELWASGIADARILATLIADPMQAKETATAWMTEADNYGLAGMVAAYIAKAPDALEMAEFWKDSDKDLHGSAAWHILATIAQAENDLPEGYFEKLIEKVEREVHSRLNRTRYSMVCFLISAGGRSENLRAQALAAAERIGNVHVDHGDTSCKTPDPLTAIEKAFAHRHRKKK